MADGLPMSGPCQILIYFNVINMERENSVHRFHGICGRKLPIAARQLGECVRCFRARE